MVILENSHARIVKINQYEPFEITLKGPSSGNPFTDVTLYAQFKYQNRTLQPDGFYDGNGNYKIRFMPDSTGEWSYCTFSNCKELDGKTGKLLCIPALKDVHGIVNVHKKFGFAYSDGTPFYPVGTTCYAWVWQSDNLVKQTLETIKNSPFNKIRMGVFPKQYISYIQTEPPFYPYEGSKEKGWDFTRFNPQYFRHFEEQIVNLMLLGIEADVILFHPYDWGKWGYDSMSRDENTLYLNYVTARLAVYRNVWWSLANEWDLIESKPAEDWNFYLRTIAEKDPYQHLRSIHNGMKWFDQSNPYITHLSVQTTDLFHIQDWRNTYHKPVVIDECCYEGDVPQDWGNLPAEEMVHRFWVSWCRGGYCTHGETYLHPDNILWWSKGGELHGQSPARIGFLRTIMEDRIPEDVVPFHNLWNKEMYLLKENEYYLFYYGYSQQKSAKIFLPDHVKFTVEIIDTWNMKITPVEGLFSGETDIPMTGNKFMAIRAILKK